MGKAKTKTKAKVKTRSYDSAEYLDTPEAIADICLKPAIAGLTEDLVNLAKPQYRQLLARLVPAATSQRRRARPQAQAAAHPLRRDRRCDLHARAPAHGLWTDKHGSAGRGLRSSRSSLQRWRSPCSYPMQWSCEYRQWKAAWVLLFRLSWTTVQSPWEL